MGNFDPRFEGMRWLITYINSRSSSSNLKASPATASVQVEVIQPSGDRDSADESTMSTESNSNSGLSGREFLGFEESAEVDKIVLDLDEEVAKLSSEGSPSEAESISKCKALPKKRKKDQPVYGRSWAGDKLSNKTQLQKTDDQIKHAMERLDKSLKSMRQQSATPTPEMDEESLYCMSLAPTMRRLDPQKKAVIRNSIKRVFCEVEYGNPVMQNLSSANSFPASSFPTPTPIGVAMNRQTYYGDDNSALALQKLYQ